jgi:hypothetical protein
MNKILFSILLSLFCVLISTVSGSQELRILGYLERARVGTGDLILVAKLDTGADVSSLGYRKLTRFKKNGVRWVRFTVRDESRRDHKFELPIIGTSKIRRRGGKGSLKRPIVEIQLCVGGISVLTPVNLANRTRFSTKLLIGRSFLHRRALVDSSRALKTELTCPGGKISK